MLKNLRCKKLLFANVGIFIFSAIAVALALQIVPASSIFEETNIGVSNSQCILSALLPCTVSSALSGVLLFVAGFSNLGVYVLALLAIFRGVAAGYIASVYFADRLLLECKTVKPAYLFDLSRFGVITVLYVLASIMLFAAGSVWLCRFEASRDGATPRHGSFRVFILFNALFGATFAFDILRGVFLCL